MTAVCALPTVMPGQVHMAAVPISTAAAVSGLPTVASARTAAEPVVARRATAVRTAAVALTATAAATVVPVGHIKAQPQWWSHCGSYCGDHAFPSDSQYQHPYHPYERPAPVFPCPNAMSSTPPRIVAMKRELLQPARPTDSSL